MTKLLHIIKIIIIISIFVAGIYATQKLAEDIREYQQEIDFKKWNIGETRNGITLIGINNDFWNYDAVFEYEGQTIIMGPGDSRMFSENILLKIERINSDYVLAEVG